MSAKVRRELSLIIIVILVAAFLAGCSQDTKILFHENGSGSYEETFVIGKNLWDSAVADIADDEMLLSYFRTLYPQAAVTISDETVQGTASKVICIKMDFKDLQDFQQMVSGWELQSIRFNPNYFSRSDIYMPLEEEETESTIGFADELEQLVSSSDDETGKLLASELQKMNVSMTIQFPYQVADTNGALQEDGRTVVWNRKQMNKERLYALFRTVDSLTAPAYKGAVNGKAYNTGVSITIDSENLLKNVEVNGEPADSDQLFLSAEDVYHITASDINGNTSRLSFRIDKTKPVVKGVKDGKTYKTARTIRFSDQGSGIEKASLNGRAIKTGKKVSQKGTYTLNVTDKAGNRKQITFKIK